MDEFFVNSSGFYCFSISKEAKTLLKGKSHNTVKTNKKTNSSKRPNHNPAQTKQNHPKQRGEPRLKQTASKTKTGQPSIQNKNPTSDNIPIDESPSKLDPIFARMSAYIYIYTYI